MTETTKSTRFQITANGMDMGMYEAPDEDAALDAYAQDAGYSDYADMTGRLPGAASDDVTAEAC